MRESPQYHLLLRTHGKETSQKMNPLVFRESLGPFFPVHKKGGSRRGTGEGRDADGYWCVAQEHQNHFLLLFPNSHRNFRCLFNNGHSAP